MKLCVVGNGPSAKGHGAEIDACDFVVRIKAWWENGAEDAGSRCDALAHYGLCPGGSVLPRPTGEHWITQTVAHIEGHDDGWDRLDYINRVANHRPIRWLTTEAWWRLQRHIKSDPTTGIIAVFIGLIVAQPAELLLYGFDSTTTDRPNFWDARETTERKSPHDVLAEKRIIAKIANGKWLGKPTETKLIWPDMPELT